MYVQYDVKEFIQLKSIQLNENGNTEDHAKQNTLLWAACALVTLASYRTS